jgi:hypothetical protein
MKKGGGKNPKFDGSSGNEPKQQEATGTGTTANKYRAPFKPGCGPAGWKQQRTSSSSSSTWFLFYRIKNILHNGLNTFNY